MIICRCYCVHMYHGMTCCGRRRSSPSILTADTHKLMCADCESMVLAFAVEAMLCTVYSKKLAQEDLADVYEQDGTSGLVPGGQSRAADNLGVHSVSSISQTA